MLPSKLKSPNVADQESFGAWLRREMTARGYDVDSPRGGGRTTLAAESGVSISIISRILTGERAAEVDTLRKIGRVLGYDIIQMMIHAGLIEYTEVSASDSGTVTESATVAKREPLQDPGDLGPNVWFGSLDRWEQELLTALRQFPPQVRMRVLEYAQLVSGERAPETLLGERRNNNTG